MDGFLALGGGANKNKDEEPKMMEGLQKESPELALDMPNEDLVELAKKWEGDWKGYVGKWEKKWKKNERYWLGKQFSDSEMQMGDVPIDNVIFEAVETALPMMTSRNPEPLVSSDTSDEGKMLEKTVRGMLVYQADRLRLKKRLKKVGRHWLIYMVGAMKMGWSMKNNDISCPVIHPTKLILDPNGTVDDDMNYTGYYVGEWLEARASDLITRFPSCKKQIDSEVKGKFGSPVKYTEWWTDDYVFWKMKDVVLGKSKNPHWNEDSQQVVVDEMGNESQQMVTGKNHFTSKEKPYVFLSIFSLGKAPHDDTSLIEQAIPMQDILNKRQKQIDKNVEGINGGWIISEERSGLNKEQAAQAVEAIRKGGALVAPQGAANEVASHIMAGGLPPDVFNNLQDVRNEIKNLFGISGSTPQGIKGDKTKQGKQIIKAQDESRMGTMIEAVEQFSDKVFNWWVQLMYVHYDEMHSASIIGADKAKEYITIKNDQFVRKITVTVKEGSLMPKDPVAEAAQASELFAQDALDPITLYDKVGFANPVETAKKLWMWQNDPTSFFANDPKVQQIIQGQQASQQEAELKQAHVMDQEHQNSIEEIAAKSVASKLAQPNEKANPNKDKKYAKGK